ncbi:MAG: DNA-processing protein DprA [Bacteroidetes bacterium]|jgi:DNA processing protein|nr:DNA-processing protein DprA [Bacteroidota bacterium]
MSEQLLYQIGLTLIPGIGDVLGKKLVAYCGGPKAVFEERRAGLEKIPGIGMITLRSILSQKVLSRAEEEIEFIQKNNIQALFYLDRDYPKRLQHCADSPMLLYYSGKASLNEQKVIGVVGTRNASEYGKRLCDQLLDDLKSENMLVVSGLAYGIDVCAHRNALKVGLPTVGVLGHGLDRIYPFTHKSVASRMQENGGLLTEFMSQTIPDRENFPKRNRIVAGMVDALIVVESAKKGGALITADIANSYNRDVFAFPGRVGDTYSEGCNFLIRTNKAAMIENSVNLKYMMGWHSDNKKKTPMQTQLFREFSEEEQKVMDAFNGENLCDLDQLLIQSNLTASKLAGVLLGLEFEGILVALPGKRYQKAN